MSSFINSKRRFIEYFNSFGLIFLYKVKKIGEKLIFQKYLQ